MAKKKEPTFEHLLDETEELVDALESGELSLDESLKKYEKGIQNLRVCAQQLTQAEEKVKVLVEKTAGVFQLDDLDVEDDDNEDD